LNLWPSV